MLIDGYLSSTSASFYPSKLFAKTKRRKGTEVLIETSIRKQLRLKAHTVTEVEETEQCMIIRIDRLGQRLLGVCRQRCREVHDVPGGAPMARPVDEEIAVGPALLPTAG